MVASYTSNGRITKQGTNDNPNTWGQVTNTQVIELLEEMITGVIDVDITGSVNVTLTANNGTTDQARHAVLELSGVLGADIDLLVPAVEKKYFIRGLWTGAYTVSVKISGSATEVVINSGEKKIVYTDGADIYDMVDTGLFVSSDDTTSANLNDKLTVDTPLIKTIDNPSANEELNLSLDSALLLGSLGLQGGQGFKVGAASTTDITIYSGGYSSDDGVFMEVSSDLTKGIDASWTAGTAQGGLDTGTVGANTVYYVFVIHNPSTGVTDGLISTSRTSPTMPSGYTKKRLLGFIRTDVSNLITEWNIVWTSFGPFTGPTAWLMAETDSSNAVTGVYFVLGTNPSTTGARVVLLSDGAVEADGDVTAFASS
jgi:hypothetical protein